MKERFGLAAGFIFIYTEDKTLQCYGQIPEAGELQYHTWALHPQTRKKPNL